MTRLIDANKLKFVLAPIAPVLIGDEVHWETIILKDRIDNAPTVEIPAWIPCSERLPKIGQHCFITTKDGDVDMDMYCSFGWDDYGDEVLAWMELPEPYEESET